MTIRQSITITNKAADRIKHLLKNTDYLGIKIAVNGKGCSGFSYSIEYAKSIEKYDEIIKDKEVTVLIDPKAIMFILGTELDYVEEMMQSGFKFKNPNEKSRCGCGESFSV